MSREYLPDQEKRILLSALSHEMKLVKDNNFTELIPVVKNLDYKFMYDRLFKQIEDKAYQQGRADALNIDMEKPMHFTAEQKAWIKNYIIQNAKSVRTEERERIIKILEDLSFYGVDVIDKFVMLDEAIENVRGGEVD